MARQDWVAVGIEFVVVVFGILLALEVNQWAERHERRLVEHTYLMRLREDLVMERGETDRFRRVVERRLSAATLLERITKGTSTEVPDPRMVPWALETVSWRSFPRVHNISYGELQNTGQTNLIRSVALRRALADHYARTADHARPGEDRTSEDRFDAATAGLLSTAELMPVEKAAGNYDVMAPISASRAAAIAAEFAARRAAVDELANLAQHHAFNLRVIGQMRSRLDALISQIDAQITPAKRGR